MDQVRPLSIWTIYENPSDFPGEFVAREHQIDRYGTIATNNIRRGKTLESVREQLPPGLVRMVRTEFDPPNVVETWL